DQRVPAFRHPPGAPDRHRAGAVQGAEGPALGIGAGQSVPRLGAVAAAEPQPAEDSSRAGADRAGDVRGDHREEGGHTRRPRSRARTGTGACARGRGTPRVGHTRARRPARGQEEGGGEEGSGQEGGRPRSPSPCRGWTGEEGGPEEGGGQEGRPTGRRHGGRNARGQEGHPCEEGPQEEPV
ncbi:MAG: hypothetical protein AVDCRST_MAG10-1045, partial [uncultured Acidimicrobiales bacterium]